MKMMKRTVCLILALVIVAGILPVIPIHAVPAFQDYTVTEKDAGEYLYMLEVVTGSKGLTTTHGTADLNVRLRYVADKMSPHGEDLGSEYFEISSSDASEAFNASLTDDPVLDNGGLVTSGKSFTSLTDTQMHTLMASYTGQFNQGSDSALLQPYTANYMGLNLNVPAIPMEGGTPMENGKYVIYFKHIECIELSVSRGSQDTVSIQSVRLIQRLDYGKNQWNGGYSQERIRNAEGVVVAEIPMGEEEYVITPDDPLLFAIEDSKWVSDTHTPQDGILVQPSEQDWQDYADPWIPHEQLNIQPFEVGQMVPAAVTLDIAGHAEAGLESLLAKGVGQKAGTPGKGTAFSTPAAGALNEIGNNALSAFEDLDAMVDNPLWLKIWYRDRFGRKRMVNIPFIGVYLAYMMLENGGKLCGNSTDQWIAGIMMPGQTVGFPINLADYESLLEIELEYGYAGDYKHIKDKRSEYKDRDYTVTGTRYIDTTTDAFSVQSLSFYAGDDVGGALSCKYDPTTWSAETRVRAGLIPDYSYSAPTWKGSTLADKTELILDAGGKLQPGAPEQTLDMTNTYIVTMTSAKIDRAANGCGLTAALTYVDKGGNTQVRDALDLRSMVGRQYGYTNRTEFEQALASSSPAPYLQFDNRMSVPGQTISFIVDGVVDLDHFESLKLDLNNATNESAYQLQTLQIYKLNGYTGRTGTGQYSSSDKALPNRLFSISVDKEQVPCAFTNRQVLLQASVPSATVNLTYVDGNGNSVAPETDLVVNDYLERLPTSMTYEDTLKDLGLSVSKYNYQVDVTVGNVEDAGSANLFFFQLVFEHGTSGVVLANQQLEADSFRRGKTEGFTIQTTQNYGDLRSVRIIADSASSSSSVFDKLNIELLTVTIRGTNGVNQVWKIDDIGWIDISYSDEGSSYRGGGSDVMNMVQRNNASLMKEYTVTGTDMALELQFCVTTSSVSFSNGIHTPHQLMGGDFYMQLTYTDRQNRQKTISKDLISLFRDYNQTDDTSHLFRANHTDRFLLMLSDVKSLDKIAFSRTGGQFVWQIKNVSVQIVTGKSDVYLHSIVKENQFTTEYVRNVESASDLTCTTNIQPVAVGGAHRQELIFDEHTITIAPNADTDSWDATVDRVPQVTNDRLNIYLYPGTYMQRPGEYYTLDPDYGICATLKYTTIFGGHAVQTKYKLQDVGKRDGRTVLYATDLSADTMSNLINMTLQAENATGGPKISHAVVEQVRDGVIVETYYIHFNTTLSNDLQRSPTVGQIYKPMKQTVRLQLAAGQEIALEPETCDLAVALRYTSGSAPESLGHVYTSPYIFVTDQEYEQLISGTDVTLDFGVNDVDKVVGLNVVTTGPIIHFAKAMIHSYKEDGTTLIETCSLSEPFTATTTQNVVDSNAVDTVVPAILTFTTAPDSQVIGAGTEAQVILNISYVDTNGDVQTEQVSDLAKVLQDGDLSAGSTATLSLLLKNAIRIESLSISVAEEDDWFLNAVTATVHPAEGKSLGCETTVNNWVKPMEKLEVDVRPVAYRDDTVVGNEIQKFELKGESKLSGAQAQVGTDETLRLEVYAKDTVDLTPVLTLIGTPDTAVIWSLGDYEKDFIVHVDGSATLMVPKKAEPGTVYNVSVSCAGNSALRINVMITVVEEPEEPPVEDPADPTEEPEDPTERPEDPTERPEDPTERPEDPTEKPTKPKD